MVGNDLTYETLWQITQKEKQTNELQLLPKTFYKDINEFLSGFSEKELTESEETTKKNTIRLLNDLYERRKQKILIYVAYKKQIPQPAIQTELDFYNRVLEFANGNSVEVLTPQKPHAHILKSLQSIPEIILPSGKKIGPFEKGQVLEIAGDEGDVEFLVNNTICQRVQ